MIAAPVLQTARLTLRPPQAGDWPAYRAYRLSERSTPAMEDESLAWTLFAALFGHWQLRGFGRFIATLSSDGRAVGHFGPHHPEGQAERELTWTLWDGALEGTGLAFEAASAVRDHARDGLGWRTAVSYIRQGNVRSQRLAARLGAVADAGAPRHLPDLTVWRHWRQAA